MGSLSGVSLPAWGRPWLRALVLAVVVGSTLVLINHGDHLLSEPICEGFSLKVGLSYVTPFVVSLASTALAERDRKRQGS